MLHLFEELFNTKYLEDKITRYLLENIPVDELYDNCTVKGVPWHTINILENRKYKNICETSSSDHLECAPHCGKLMPIVDTEDKFGTLLIKQSLLKLNKNIKMGIHLFWKSYFCYLAVHTVQYITVQYSTLWMECNNFLVNRL